MASDNKASSAASTLFSPSLYFLLAFLTVVLDVKIASLELRLGNTKISVSNDSWLNKLIASIESTIGVGRGNPFTNRGLNHCVNLHTHYRSLGFPRPTPIVDSIDAINLFNQESFETDILVLPRRNSNEAILTSRTTVRKAKRKYNEGEKSVEAAEDALLSEAKIHDLRTPIKMVKIKEEPISPIIIVISP